MFALFQALWLVHDFLKLKCGNCALFEASPTPRRIISYLLHTTDLFNENNARIALVGNSRAHRLIFRCDTPHSLSQETATQLVIPTLYLVSWLFLTRIFPFWGQGNPFLSGESISAKVCQFAISCPQGVGTENRKKSGGIKHKVYTVLCELFIRMYCQYHQKWEAINYHRHVSGISQEHNGVGFGQKV